MNAQQRFSFMSMGIGFIVPPVLYLTSPVVASVRAQLNFVYPFVAQTVVTGFTLFPPSTSVIVDATYVIVRRFIRNQFVYYTERFDDRLWPPGVAEAVWCVDAGLAYPLFAPQATLSAAAPSGSQNITSYEIIQGGTGGLTAATGTINDPTGTGATVSLTVAGGTVSMAVAGTTGSFYSNPQLLVLSQNGVLRPDVIIQPVVTNIVAFQTDVGVFSSSYIGNVIRMGGGIATITGFSSSTSIQANITTPITSFPSDPGDQPIPSAPGQWTMGVPTNVVTGLNHLEGLTVTGTADGYVIPPTVVSGGSISLGFNATMITVGLPFTAQLQSLRLDIPGEMTLQGRRKDIFAVTARVNASRGFSISTNQQDASTQPNVANVQWSSLIEWKQRNAISAGNSAPLFTGDARINVKATWRKEGQIALQQNYPLPLEVMAIIPETVIGDEPG